MHINCLKIYYNVVSVGEREMWVEYKTRRWKDIKVKEFSSFYINVGNNKRTAVYGYKAHI